VSGHRQRWSWNVVGQLNVAEQSNVMESDVTPLSSVTQRSEGVQRPCVVSSPNSRAALHWRREEAAGVCLPWNALAGQRVWSRVASRERWEPRSPGPTLFARLTRQAHRYREQLCQARA
jgi:hypothetical protein